MGDPYYRGTFWRLKSTWTSRLRYSQRLAHVSCLERSHLKIFMQFTCCRTDCRLNSFSPDLWESGKISPKEVVMKFKAMVLTKIGTCQLSGTQPLEDFHVAYLRDRLQTGFTFARTVRAWKDLPLVNDFDFQFSWRWHLCLESPYPVSRKFPYWVLQ